VTTPTSPPLPPPVLISKRFRRYDKAIRDIWESFHFHSFYLPILHRLIKAEKVSAFVLPNLAAQPSTKKLSRKNTLGTVSHIMSQVSPRSMISAVAQTELFLQYLVIRVLRRPSEEADFWSAT
jgi:hypothetical protein